MADQKTPERHLVRGHGAGRSARGDEFVAGLRGWAEALPSDAVFTGLTAARLHGLWLPPLPESAPIFVAAPEGTQIRRPQIRAVRHPRPPERAELDGVPVTPIPETVVACARELGVLDLLVVVDSASRILGGPTELAVAAQRRRRGAPALRRALRHADWRSESPYETLLRVLHVVCDVGVTPQAVILDRRQEFVARADLLITGTRVLQEYDGGDHLERAQYRRDRHRESRLHETGHIRHGYVAADLLSQPARILRNADLALGRPHEPARLRRWSELLRPSLFTASGRAAATQRWRVAAKAA